MGGTGCFRGHALQGATEPWASVFVGRALSPKTCASPVRSRSCGLESMMVQCQSVLLGLALGPGTGRAIRAHGTGEGEPQQVSWLSPHERWHQHECVVDPFLLSMFGGLYQWHSLASDR